MKKLGKRKISSILPSTIEAYACGDKKCNGCSCGDSKKASDAVTANGTTVQQC